MVTKARVMAVFAHPDDESILAGGTLAACAAAAHNVRIVSLTRGEWGPISYPDLATRETLGAIREQELCAAATALGLSESDVECLRYPDGELHAVDRAQLLEDLTRRIRSWRPDAMITFGPEGLYWHRDHVTVHELTLAAVEGLPADAHRPEMYFATWPEGLARDVVRAMEARGTSTDLWGLHPDDFGAPENSISTIVDVRQFLRKKLRAIRCHRTQLPSGHLFRGIPDDLAEEIFGCEYFSRGRDVNQSADWLLHALGQDRQFVPCMRESAR